MAREVTIDFVKILFWLFATYLVWTGKVPWWAYVAFGLWTFKMEFTWER